MTKTHEQLRKDVDASLKRLDDVRVARVIAYNAFKVNRLGLIVFIISTPILFPLMNATLGLIVGFTVLTLMMLGIWRFTDNMTSGKQSAQRHRERELEGLDVLCERLDALHERDTLMLMDIERYNELEAKAMRQEAQRKEVEAMQYTRKVKLASGKRMRYVTYVDGEEYFINGW